MTTEMTSSKPGNSTSKAEILGISNNGVWMLVNDKEYFMPYKEFPWFNEARVCDVYNVELIGKSHIHWPSLDIDLDIDCLNNPADYPLVYK